MIMIMIMIMIVIIIMNIIAGEPLSLPEDPRDLKALREAVAAVGLPDEAMPGSRTDLRIRAHRHTCTAHI